MLLKGMGENFLLSKDEPLTHNIGGVMTLGLFRWRAQTAKNWQKIDLLILVFIYFHPRPLVRYVLELVFPELGNRPRREKTPVHRGPRERGE